MKINKHLDYQKEVWATDTITGIEKLVLLAIAGHFNWTNKQEAFPSNELIAKETMLGIRTVIRAKNALVKKGWLISERRFNKSNFYTPTIPNSATLAPLESNSATQTPQGCHSDMSGGVTEYKLIDKGIDNLIDNNNGSAVKESEVISQEEELFIPLDFLEEELLETRSKIPSEYLYLLSSDYTFNHVRQAIQGNPDLRQIIFDKKLGK